MVERFAQPPLVTWPDISKREVISQLKQKQTLRNHFATLDKTHFYLGIGLNDGGLHAR